MLIISSILLFELFDKSGQRFYVEHVGVGHARARLVLAQVDGQRAQCKLLLCTAGVILECRRVDVGVRVVDALGVVVDHVGAWRASVGGQLVLHVSRVPSGPHELAQLGGELGRVEADARRRLDEPRGVAGFRLPATAAAAAAAAAA